MPSEIPLRVTDAMRPSTRNPLATPPEPRNPASHRSGQRPTSDAVSTAHPRPIFPCCTRTCPCPGSPKAFGLHPTLRVPQLGALRSNAATPCMKKKGPCRAPCDRSHEGVHALMFLAKGQGSQSFADALDFVVVWQRGPVVRRVL